MPLKKPLLSLLTWLLLTSSTLTLSQYPMVMLFVYDGFRWDLLDRMFSYGYKLPTFEKLIKTGVKAHHVHNVFPTVTMPSHMSILTGLYPESHGIVYNHYYDPQLNSTYHMSSEEDNLQSEYFDNGAEPIWVTNQKARNGRFTGSTVFPDTLTPVKGVVVTHQINTTLFNPNITYAELIDYAISWFNDPTEPINLCLFYYPEPDEISHKFGPESTEVINEIINLDNWTGLLLDQLEQNGLRDRVNLIFTGDHGQTYISPNRLVILDDYVNDTDMLLTGWGQIGMITPHPGKEEKVFAQLKKLEMDNPQMRVFWKNDTSPEFRALHYTHSDRINSIIILPDLGWTLLRAQDIDNFTSAGSHGYSNMYSDMWPYFIANGPAFREDFKTGTIQQVDIYELMCHLLDLTPAPNNGSFGRIQHILKQHFTFTTYITFAGTISLCTLIALFVSYAAIVSANNRKSWNLTTWNNIKYRPKDWREQSQSLLDDSDEINEL